MSFRQAASAPDSPLDQSHLFEMIPWNSMLSSHNSFLQDGQPHHNEHLFFDFPLYSQSFLAVPCAPLQSQSCTQPCERIPLPADERNLAQIVAFALLPLLLDKFLQLLYNAIACN